jgi:NADH-quinone oxidoreductase subunit J
MWGRIIAGFLGLALLAEIMAMSRGALDLRLRVPPIPATVASTGGIIGSIAAPMFKEYLLAFELTSVLLLAAIMGAVVLAKRRG